MTGLKFAPRGKKLRASLEQNRGGLIDTLIVSHCFERDSARRASPPTVVAS
jgi:hypothetical protein